MAKQVNPPAKKQEKPAVVDRFQEQIEQGVLGPDGRDYTKVWEQIKEIVKKQSP